MKQDPLGLWRLATGDAQVIATCDSGTRRLYLLAGLAMGAMCIVTPISLHRVISEAFQAPWMAWAGSAMFSAMMLNIYRLSMATIGGEVLPSRRAGKRRPLTSLLLRVLFLCGFACFLSAPLCTLVFRETGEAYVADRRAAVRSEIEELARQQSQQWAGEDEVLSRAGATRSASDEAARESLRLAMTRRLAAVGHDRFFVGRIRHTYATERLSFAITALLMALFVAPMLIKRKAFNRPDHLAAMQALERELVLDEYRLFQEAWSQVELEHGVVMMRNERYEDPPFNTQPKEKPPAESWDAFKTWFKGN